MIVGRIPSRNFRVDKSSNSFIGLEIYIGVEAEKFFSLYNTLLSVLAHLFWC